MEGSIEKLYSSLETQISICHALIACLDQEEDELRHNHFEALPQINEKKAEISKQLEKESSAYQIMLGQLTGDEPSNEALLASNTITASEKSKFSGLLEELKQLSKDCQFKNEVNGRVIQVNKHINDQLVSILKGVDKDAGVYDASGKMDT